MLDERFRFGTLKLFTREFSLVIELSSSIDSSKVGNMCWLREIFKKLFEAPD